MFEAQSLQNEIFSEVCMAYCVLLILLNDSLPIIRLISRCGINNEFHLILYFDEEIISVRLSLNKFYRIFHDFREHKYTFPFKLLQCLIGNLARKGSYIGKSVFFMLIWKDHGLNIARRNVLVKVR